MSIFEGGLKMFFLQWIEQDRTGKDINSWGIDFDNLLDAQNEAKRLIKNWYCQQVIIFRNKTKEIVYNIK